MDGAVMAGWPSPGVRFVVQPNAANDAIAAAAANPRKPPYKCCVFLCIEASSFSLDYWLFRATGAPKGNGFTRRRGGAEKGRVVFLHSSAYSALTVLYGDVSAPNALRNADCAAQYPHMPCTPPPGGVELEAR